MSDTQPLDVIANLAELSKDATIRKQDSALGCMILKTALAINELSISMEHAASVLGRNRSTIEASILLHSLTMAYDRALGITEYQSRPWVKVDSEEALRDIARILGAEVIENGMTMSAGIEDLINFNYTPRR